jgi:hypothetical protein
MNTKVIFNIPTRVKRAAQRRAKAEGMTLSAVLQRSAAAYGAGELEIRATETLRPAVARSIKKAIDEAKRGINVSPAFTSTEESRAYLEGEIAKMKKRHQ